MTSVIIFALSIVLIVLVCLNTRNYTPQVNYALFMACKMVDVSRDTYYTYYREDPDFKKQCDDCSEIALDFAESKLHKQIEDGVPVSTTFFLKTKGKNRGYIEIGYFVRAVEVIWMLMKLWGKSKNVF